jgi:hypothetical protein
MSAVAAERPGIRRVILSDAWARRKKEEARTSKLCSAPRCEGAVEGPFDLYCNALESHLLVLASRPQLQRVLVYGLRGVFGILALAGATWHSSIPLQIAAALAGLIIVGLPLRRFATARVVAVAGWCLLVTLSAVAEDAGTSTALVHVIVETTASGLLLALLVAIGWNGETVDDLTQRALSFGLTVVAVMTALAGILSTPAAPTPGVVRHVLLLVALLAAAGVASGAAIDGFIWGMRRVRRTFQPTAPFTPPLVRAPRKPLPPQRRGFADRLLYVLGLALYRLGLHTVRAANIVLRVLWRASYFLFIAIKRARFAVGTAARVLAAAAKEAVMTLIEAATSTLRVSLRWGRSTLFPFALLAGGAAASIAWATRFTSYLRDGSLVALTLSLVFGFVAAAMLLVVPWPLTLHTRADIAAALRRNVEGAGPPLFITLVVLGWTNGILGLLGVGPMTPGWLTISGTVILVASLTYAWRNRETPDRLRAT